MTKKLLILPFFIFYCLFSEAQLNTNANLSQDSLKKELPGKIITQFINSIKPASFETSFENEKKAILKNADKANDDRALMVKDISSVAEALNQSLFKPGFNKQNLLTQVAAAKTSASAAAKLKDLEDGLKPEAFSPVWKLQRGGWLVDVEKLKSK